MAFDFEKFSKTYITLAAEKVEIEEKMKKLKEKIAYHVDLLEERKTVTKYATMYFKAATVKETVDLKKIKADDPALYEILESKGYIKKTEVKEQFDIRGKAVLIEKT